MRRRIALGILVMLDSGIVIFAPFLALLIRFEGNTGDVFVQLFLPFMPVILFIRLATFYGFGLYHRLWRYASINELLSIAASVTVSSLIIVPFLIFAGAAIPAVIHIISWFLTIILIGFSRFCVRAFKFLRQKKAEVCTNVLIIGAGDAGVMLAREIEHRFFENKKVVGFIDDDSYKQGKMIFGIRILGGRAQLEQIVSKYQVDEIMIAMPSVGGHVIRKIYDECKQTGCGVKTLPGIYELINGRVTVQQLRDVALEDLLRREPVTMDLSELAGYISGKRVLVTGAGGSIGSELCRQIATLSPSVIFLLGKGENSIYEIDRELKAKFPRLHCKPIIADVRDSTRISRIFADNKPQVVFHAAAHKHVPLMELHPEEAIRNNVFGTKSVAEAADKAGTEVFIMISTDKAVNPTSVMGATKRIAELIIQNLNDTSKTKFAAVRFGNVLGSRGSVVPLFKKQIAAGGPVTVTHPDMKRYFMTIPEAVQLVLQAGSMAGGGEVFILDMGKLVKIVDLAHDLIKLSGYEPNIDIKIEYTGIRKGEKLYEELLTTEEGANVTRNKKIYVANSKLTDSYLIHQSLIELQRAVSREDIVGIIRKLVPTYSYSETNPSNPLERAKQALGTTVFETYQPVIES